MQTGGGYERVAVFSPKISRWRNIAALYGAREVVLRPKPGSASQIDAVIGWGDKVFSDRALRYARDHHIPYLRAEDGFLRSIGLGSQGFPPLSVVLDDIGVYYDALRPSRLERLLEGPQDSTADPLKDVDLLTRAGALREKIVAAGLSKYNDSPQFPACLDKLPQRFVLVVDQTRGDLSIEGGRSGPGTFEQMVQAALDENPDLPVIVKLHPEVIAGKKRGHLKDAAALSSRIAILGESVNAADLFDRVERIYVCTSQVGFDALLAKVPVTCFGAPFYSGWGLTDDRVTVERRTTVRSLNELVAGTLIVYPRYVHPRSGAPCPAEDVVDHLSLQREIYRRNAGDWLCFGFSYWKRPIVRSFLKSPGNRVHFTMKAENVPSELFKKSTNILAWGESRRREAEQIAERLGTRVHRMEDGLLRSVGLGSDINAPLSLVVDSRGIYYDPSQPSDLEVFLSTHVFTDAERNRGALLRKSIVRERISKYNFGAEEERLVPFSIADAKSPDVILVPGQVADDASIRLGCQGQEVSSNHSLLSAVRKARPDAYILYKPHPDVVSGNRDGAIEPEALQSLADSVIYETSLANCLDVVTEVHTMTSLVGFESLLRGLKVTTYGRPFYSGWSLTNDMNPLDRRSRKLSLDELVYATLVLYPRYYDYSLGEFTTPEAVIAQLSVDVASAPSNTKLQIPRPIRRFQRLLRAVKLSLSVPRS
jgi:capsular polysaccharide export protein